MNAKYGLVDRLAIATENRCGSHLPRHGFYFILTRQEGQDVLLGRSLLVDVEDRGQHRSLPVVRLNADVTNVDGKLSSGNVENWTSPILTESVRIHSGRHDDHLQRTFAAVDSTFYSSLEK